MFRWLKVRHTKKYEAKAVNSPWPHERARLIVGKPLVEIQADGCMASDYKYRQAGIVEYVVEDFCYPGRAWFAHGRDILTGKAFKIVINDAVYDDKRGAWVRFV